MKTIEQKPHLQYDTVEDANGNFMGKVIIESTCPWCRTRTRHLPLMADQVIDWLDGKLIQDALPMLDADTREQLVSGICPSCWEKTFGDKKEEN